LFPRHRKGNARAARGQGRSFAEDARLRWTASRTSSTSRAPEAFRDAIRFFLGIDVEAITPFTGTTVVPGEPEPGTDPKPGIGEPGASTHLYRSVFR